jgi:hypothetical protein
VCVCVCVCGGVLNRVTVPLSADTLLTNAIKPALFSDKIVNTPSLLLGLAKNNYIVIHHYNDMIYDIC